jgi:hypothetical protein
MPVGLTNLTAAVSASLAANLFVMWSARTMISERIKNGIKSEYDTKLESFKTQLKADADMRLLALQAKAKENELRYNILQEKRANIIADTYAALADMLDSLNLFTSSRPKNIMTDENNQAERELGDDLFKKCNVFRAFFSKQRIYFPKNVAKSLHEISELIGLTGFEFHINSQLRKDKNRPFFVGDPEIEELFLILNKIEEQIEPALEGLGDEMRRLLGSDT